MCTPLAKLAIGLSATMATGFYYLAAAPPATAAVDVCGPGNYSTACEPDNTPSPQSPETEPDPQLIPNLPDPLPPPVVIPVTKPTLPNIYDAPGARSTSIPEPGTAIALLMTGAAMICSGRKRNKQVGQQR